MALVDGEGKTIWGVEPTLLGECSSPFDIYAHNTAARVANSLAGGRPDNQCSTEVQRRELGHRLVRHGVHWLGTEQLFIYPSLPFAALDREPEDNHNPLHGLPPGPVRIARSRPFDPAVVTGAFGLAFKASEGDSPATTRLYDLLGTSEIHQRVKYALAHLAMPLPSKPPKHRPLPYFN